MMRGYGGGVQGWKHGVLAKEDSLEKFCERVKKKKDFKESGK